jgi:hypothetical protein
MTQTAQIPGKNFPQVHAVSEPTCSKYAPRYTEQNGTIACLVTASETEADKSWAEARIKQLTGGYVISARFMHKDFFDYEPQFKLMIVGNHTPTLHNVDDAAKRRFNIVPFILNPETPDMDLEEKLFREAGGILQWMIKGCLDWQADGLRRLACESASQGIRLRGAQPPVHHRPAGADERAATATWEFSPKWSDETL